jgi:two-component system, OmpR family, phosphate regulon response regulator OmpR
MLLRARLTVVSMRNAAHRVHGWFMSHAPINIASIDRYRFGRFTLDIAGHTLLSNGLPVRLTRSEFALLVIFIRYPLQALSRARLVELLYGPNAMVAERAIDVPVWRLRQLLEDNPANPIRIRTVRRIGYVFVPDESAAI